MEATAEKIGKLSSNNDLNNQQMDQHIIGENDNVQPTIILVTSILITCSITADECLKESSLGRFSLLKMEICYSASMLQPLTLLHSYEHIKMLCSGFTAAVYSCMLCT